MARARHEVGVEDGRFSWFVLSDPTDAELDELAGEYHVPPLAVQHLREPARRPFLAIYDHVSIAVVKTATWDEENHRVELGSVRLLIGDGFVASLEQHTGMLDEVRADLSEGAPFARAGVGAVLPLVVDHAARGYGPVVAALTDETEDVEADLFEDAAARPTRRIYRLSREVLTLRRVMSPLPEMLDRMLEHTDPAPAGRSRRKFAEKRAHLVHLLDSADVLTNLLSNALQANLTQVSVRQNDDMRKISALAAIWAIPTLFAGVWGMNFAHMPELGLLWGYPLALALMVGVSYAVYVWFRRAGWLGRAEDDDHD